MRGSLNNSVEANAGTARKNGDASRTAAASATRKPQEKNGETTASRIDRGGSEREIMKKKRNPLATAYFPKELPLKYRLRWSVSLPCSVWERVGPLRSSHQEIPQLG